MGIVKELMMRDMERGYTSSSKYCCQFCVGDTYLKKYITTNGIRGKCSFCSAKDGKIRYRKVIPVDELVKAVMPAINEDYESADGIPYDEEEKKYLGRVIDQYDLVYDELAPYIDSEHIELYDELYRILQIDLLTNIIVVSESKELIKLWEEYCSLVSNRTESVEQIVSLMVREDAPDDLKQIDDILTAVLSIIELMKMTDTINPSECIYRAVNYLEKDAKSDGFDAIVANSIGTPPASFVKPNRYSEKGDMMFYGACNEEIIKKEISKSKDNPYTIGCFHTNKRIRVIDLSRIASWKQPSYFDVDNKDKRELWLFLNMFIKVISREINNDKYYKPTQLLNKYIQRTTNYRGIEYRSSKSKHKDYNSVIVHDRCYVLYATNRDCLDECERTKKLDKSRLQLFMKSYKQV